MPIYEFRCEKCEEVSEVICTMGTQVIKGGCVHCHGDLKVIPSPPGLAKLKTPAYGIL